MKRIPAQGRLSLARMQRKAQTNRHSASDRRRRKSEGSSPEHLDKKAKDVPTVNPGGYSEIQSLRTEVKRDGPFTACIYAIERLAYFAILHYGNPYGGNPYGMSPEDELQVMKEEADGIKSDPEGINKRIQELESKSSQS